MILLRGAKILPVGGLNCLITLLQNPGKGEQRLIPGIERRGRKIIEGFSGPKRHFMKIAEGCFHGRHILSKPPQKRRKSLKKYSRQ
jgi:hypothetical protein